MSRRVRIWLVVSVLSQYACTMLLGQALHSLAGCDHHADDVHEAVLAGQPAEGLATDSGDEHHDADSCPICQCHFLAQQPASTAMPRWSELPGREFFAGAPVDTSASPLRPYSSRAPPFSGV